MTSFTFTSEDLERVNKDKKQDDKIFLNTENFRNAHGLDTDEKINTLFIADAKRCGAIAFKPQNNKVESLIGIEFASSDNQEGARKINKQIQEFQKKVGVSDRQIQDLKMLSNQGTAIAGSLPLYAVRKKEFEMIATNMQCDDGIPVQFEINNKNELICRTTSKIILDKDKMDYNFASYNKGTSDDIKTSDYIIATAEVNLGQIGKADYIPFTTCHLHAEGKNSEAVLKKIQEDIDVSLSLSQNPKTSESIKEEHHKLQSEILDVTGAAKLHEGLVKDDIQRILKSEEPLGSVQMLRELNSTPKIFVNVLVDRISEINKIEDPKTRDDAMKKLQDNSQTFFDHNEKTAGLVNKLSGSIDFSNQGNLNTIKQSFTAVVSETLDDLYRKNNIATLLNPEPGKLYSINVQALREDKSTPKLFAEALVDRISEINNITDHKEHAQAMKQLSDNAAQFVDQPKGYMKVLINDTAKEMAKEGNINLPKQGIISKISHNIELMLAKINVKIHGKSPQLKEHKELITQARVQTQQKQNTGYSR